MKRAFSIGILTAAFVVMGLEASAYSSDSNATVMTSSSTSLQVSTGDNCGAEGYSWLDENGQLIES
ncbi:MAG: hypothetical protein QNJ87_17290 [Gammaproteobacteria bacterium]|nr:hypothetical protein [Gammaproteobacteria bacterium]MDJ0873511.1 hypothetical protein [Gammaproteobacteria bacterium]MDJ0892879.1 hypothetical protein [Gammaproteobacteria bacterium]